MKKELMIELCSNLEKDLNLREGKEIHKVKFESGLKPYGYFRPSIHVGTTKTLPNEIEMAWFVEIWVDGECIFRECISPHETESLEIIESVLIERILRNIFTFGVMSSKDFITIKNKVE